MEKYKLYSILLENRKSLIKGIVEDYSESWILLNGIFSDYMVDGSKMVNQNRVKKIVRESDEVFIEDVLRANSKISTLTTKDVPLGDSKSLLSWLMQNNEVIQVGLKDESEVFVGRVRKILDKSFYLEPLTPKGLWLEGDYLFRINSIYTIDFKTDYINSLVLYSETL